MDDPKAATILGFQRSHLLKDDLWDTDPVDRLESVGKKNFHIPLIWISMDCISIGLVKNSTGPSNVPRQFWSYVKLNFFGDDDRDDGGDDDDDDGDDDAQPASRRFN